MKRIREILLTQYIGAITVGFILAQAAIHFINEIAGAVAEYWAIQQDQGSAMGTPRSFHWANFIVSMASVALHLLVGVLLIRWLYADEKTQSGDQEAESSGVELEP
jgi:ABC-type Fe3+-siderophore transport system permease subunit